MVVEHGWLTGMEMIAEIEQANEIKGDAFEKQKRWQPQKPSITSVLYHIHVSDFEKLPNK